MKFRLIVLFIVLTAPVFGQVTDAIKPDALSQPVKEFTAIGKELIEIARIPYLPTQLRTLLDLMDRAKAEDLDGMLLALEESERSGVKTDVIAGLYWRRRAELEGTPVLERFLVPDENGRAVSSSASSGLSATMEACLIKHRTATLEWMRARKEHVLAPQIFLSGVSILARLDFPAATDLFFELKAARTPAEITGAAGALVSHLRRFRDISGMVEWVEKLPPERKAVLIREVAVRMARYADFDTGSKWFASQVGEEWQNEGKQREHLAFIKRFIATQPQTS